ncbi:hypothetical protein RFI_30738, partial [Reticulomyxa filosa]
IIEIRAFSSSANVYFYLFFFKKIISICDYINRVQESIKKIGREKLVGNWEKIKGENLLEKKRGKNSFEKNEKNKNEKYKRKKKLEIKMKKKFKKRQ